ncbi:MAG: DUF3427 domain-containing protein [Solobacterium sp.]|nr:DUF3427 domain-containing protein [Solobacterium sp.]
MIREGLYEQIINREIQRELQERKDSLKAYTADLDQEESSKILSSYAAEIIEHVLSEIEGVDRRTEVVNRIVDVLSDYSAADNSRILGNEIVSEEEKTRMLNAVINRNTPKYRLSGSGPARPETSIARSSLFTGAPNEPNLYSEFCREIESCNRIDMLVSFVKWSGIVLILDALNEFTAKGGILRIISTTYLGATDAKAIHELSKLPNTEIKISYDTKRTRLHAKTYVFYRDTGFTTAYVGSSNLSNAAMSSGLEWNMKITEKDLPETFDKIAASFTGYWNMKEFELYHAEDYARLSEAIDHERHRNSSEVQLTYNFTIHPYSYQQEVLDQLAAERELRGHYRNLVVAATGTGKTVISAFDYKRFVSQNPGKPNRLLFVAHREEILKQSLACFRGVLKDQNFGDLLVGQFQKPKDYEHLFISIASFNSRDLISMTEPDYYDYIVLDESHHDAAPSYQKLLSYYQPKILLGLTATPERMDGQNILEYFDHRIAAEIRLPEAIDRKLLVPFQYFCITDTVDLSKLSWRRGGYVTEELERAYIGDTKNARLRAETILRAVYKYVADMRDVKGIGFCVSVEHAHYMAGYFNDNGVSSVALTGSSDQELRESAAGLLRNGALKFIFAVDIYNEGVDIPEVNTVLFLRPTESLTVFLQQLGRGLRLSEGKEFLTVMDFIGQANEHFSYEDRFAALVERTHRSIKDEVKNGFSYLPKGCFIKMEKLAQEYVLNNIEQSYKGSYEKRIIRKLQTFAEDYGVPLTMDQFAEKTHIDMRDIYKHKTFCQLKAKAGLIPSFEEPLNEKDLMRKALQKIAWIDSRRWIQYLLKLFAEEYLQMPEANTAEYRMLQMFQYTVYGQSASDCNFDTPLDGIRKIKANPNCCAELIELLQLRLSQIDLVDEHAELGFDCPLDVHCTYSRDQLFVACDYMTPKNIREGVKYLPEKKLDLFLITLHKSDKDYSPTTLYNDYSISDTEFHWQSQSTTSPESPTGQRYIHHKEQGNKVLLFVRNYKNRDNTVSNETEPYVFLGTANYVSHNGSRPMNVIWKLDVPIPGKYLKETNKLLDN